MNTETKVFSKDEIMVFIKKALEGMGFPQATISHFEYVLQQPSTVKHLSKEEILKKFFPDRVIKGLKEDLIYDEILDAMEEYAKQFQGKSEILYGKDNS